jgi:quercetin dioxygenase-like cupin family protein
MTHVVSSGDGVVVVRGAEAEVLGDGTPTSVRLMVDSSDAGGALSAQRVRLLNGADGATPHTHRTASELFYVLEGTIEVLAGERVVTATQGDLVVVAPNVTHAFSAAPGADAELLIVITPGVERFDYFRLLARVRLGAATLESLLDSQERFDTWFVESPAWAAARQGEM